MLLVDAYNVVRAHWVLPPARRGIDVHGLIDLIARSRFAHDRLRLVVDGRPGPRWLRHGVFDTAAGHAWTRVGRAEVVFSGRDEADDLIEAVLAAPDRPPVTLVSSDRRLVNAARAAGAAQIGNGAFLRMLNADLDRADAPDPSDPPPLDRDAVARWMREFDFEPPSAPTPKTTPAPPPPARTPAPARARRPAQPAPPPPPADPTPEPLDPALRAAFEEWYGALHLGDLDMRRWVDGVEPL